MAGPRNSHGKRSSSHSDYNDNGRNKRRNKGDDRGKGSINSEDTVYRYLCPSNKIGSVMGRGGDIVKQLRSETNSKIRIGETVSGCEERVVTIYSASDETNDFDGTDRVCPAQDALFKVHDKVAAELGPDEVAEMAPQVTARLLVPSDQIGCVIGKGGQVVQTIRTDTGAQIRIMKDNHLPPCASSIDELVQISGEASNVRKALFQIAKRLHDNPSRSQRLLVSSTMYPSVMGATAGPPIMGLTPLVGAYGGYKDENGDWGRTLYPAPRRDSSSKEFSLRLICPKASIGAVIGKGGAIINQIRQESRATVKVDSSTTEAEHCIISISSKEIFEDTFSPTIDAAIRLQPRCSEKVERDSGLISFTTRLLVPSCHIGSLIGKGGAVITEMRRITQVNIRILSKENLPKVAGHDDDMVQISGDPDLVKDALVQVASRLRANLFNREGAFSTFVQVLPYLPVSPEVSKYESRDSIGHGHGHPYSSRYGDSYDLPPNDGYGTYGGSQGRSSGDAYGSYGSYSPRRSGSSRRLSRHKSPGSSRRGYGY